MNVDPYRERCGLPELDQNKLRRVSFCVDVEIAGSAQYGEEEPEEPQPVPPIDAPSSLTKLGKDIDSKKEKEKKSKDQKLKRSEGEALKRPDAVTEEKETGGVIQASGERATTTGKSPEAEPQGQNAGDSSQNGTPKEPSRKKEKKKRSESERKERKERKQREAIANGMLPAEIKSDVSGDSGTGTDTPPTSQDRPTTDPLRIYRRCCQLRETPILKKIAEQISSPSACPVQTPGILTCLDLSGYWMQLPDIVTLGDYLAVVPVKKLIMENCGLTNEAVRVLLAGLLAAKTPEQAKYNKKLVKKGRSSEKDLTERLGVVEKVSFKNNPKIGKHGWRHIATFIYMSRSLKAIDLSMIPFPDSSALLHNISPKNSNTGEAPPPQMDMATILSEAISLRLGRDRLEELVMGDCGLTTDIVGQIVDAVIKCGATRLGLASNGMTKEGLDHIIRYIRSGVCMGLDIGGNDIHEHLDMLADTIDPTSTLWALSLADCHLTPSSLDRLMQALSHLPNFRFIDLSHNRDLFATKPSVLGLLRKYLPKIVPLKRLHLMDVAMTPEHAIALAEVLPECQHLAHLNILENHLLSPLASAKTESEQEEACALYASLMAAVRVSETIICIDVDVPSSDSSEVVKALAKQVVAYSLRNLERMPLNESQDSAQDSAIASMKEPHSTERDLTVPDVLVHLVGHMEGYPEDHDHDPPAPDDDYIVGGTGVVKALDICLNRAERGRKDSNDTSPLQSGTGTPKPAINDGEIVKKKARDVSKSLLGSARKIRMRLEPALIKEAKSGDDMNFRKCFCSPLYKSKEDSVDTLLIVTTSGRLQFLDSTLRGMIQRFEDEYPECRVSPPPKTGEDKEGNASDTSSLSLQNTNSNTGDKDAFLSPSVIDDEDDESPLIRPATRSHSLTRRSSSPSLVSRQNAEEGRIHLIGQRIKRQVLRPEMEDHAHGTTGLESEAPDLAELRRTLETRSGEEIKKHIDNISQEDLMRLLAAEKEGTSMREEMEKWVASRKEREAEAEAEAEDKEEGERGRPSASATAPATATAANT